MKKLILLLFVPLISFGQTYDDIMSINSKEQFIRVMIENGYEMISSNETEVEYALNPESAGGTKLYTSSYANYIMFNVGDIIMFEFSTKDDYGVATNNNQYYNIYESAKENCNYDKLITSVVKGHFDEKMVQYICDYNGQKGMHKKKIAFLKKDGIGHIVYTNPYHSYTIVESDAERFCEIMKKTKAMESRELTSRDIESLDKWDIEVASFEKKYKNNEEFIERYKACMKEK